MLGVCIALYRDSSMYQSYHSHHIISYHLSGLVSIIYNSPNAPVVAESAFLPSMVKTGSPSSVLTYRWSLHHKQLEWECWSQILERKVIVERIVKYMYWYSYVTQNIYHCDMENVFVAVLKCHWDAGLMLTAKRITLYGCCVPVRCFLNNLSEIYAPIINRFRSGCRCGFTIVYASSEVLLLHVPPILNGPEQWSRAM
jgi:hypothetical protein